MRAISLFVFASGLAVLSTSLAQDIASMDAAALANPLVPSSEAAEAIRSFILGLQIIGTFFGAILIAVGAACLLIRKDESENPARSL